MHADRYEVVQPGILLRTGFEQGQDPRVLRSSWRRMADAAPRHGNLLGVIGLQHEADVEDTRSVTLNNPITTWTDNSTLESRALEHAARDRDDHEVRTNSVRRLRFQHHVEQQLRLQVRVLRCGRRRLRVGRRRADVSRDAAQRDDVTDGQRGCSRRAGGCGRELRERSPRHHMPHVSFPEGRVNVTVVCLHGSFILCLTDISRYP
jgi:hypothetical protein